MVYNKCDLIDDADRTSLKIHNPDAALISALHDEGISNFIEVISSSLSSIQQTMSVCIPFDRGELVRIAHDRCSVLEESYNERGTRITMRCPSNWADRFTPYVCFDKEK